jgi:hypothetical protein
VLQTFLLKTMHFRKEFLMKTLQKILSILILLSFIGIGNVAASAMVAVAVSSPQPVYPINGALVLTNTPTLKWTASTPAAQLDHYEYQVSEDSNFSIIADSGSTTNTQETVGAPLVRSRTYYWRIRACDISANCTGWARASFRVSVEPPTLTSPADGDTLTTNRDTFRWGVVSNAAGYTIQISGSSAFSSILLQAEVPSTQTEYTPSADLPVNRLLFWRVRAKNPNYGPGPWSDVRYFYTANPPSTPEPAKPDGKLTTDISPRLFWKPITVPSGTTFEKYHVQVDNNSDFSSPEIDDDTTLTTPTPYYYDVPDPSPLNDATTYYWRVRACNSDGPHTFCSAWSKVSSFLTSVGPILALHNPANGDVLTDNRPTFDWDDSNGARSYTIQIARDPRFQYIILTANPFRSQFTPGKNLPPGKTLYWRVRGEHPVYGPGLWSVVYSFTTARPPAQPSLRSPADGSLVHSDTPDLIWSFSPTPTGTTFDYYQIQIDDDPAFASPAEDQNISNQFTPYFLAADYSGPLPRMRTYYWRVRACNTDGACSDWSNVFRFRVAIQAPTSLSCTSPTIDWDDMLGASSYRLIIARGGTILRNIVTSVSQANVSGLAPGTYTCKVRVESTFGLPYSPSLWAVDILTVP